MTSNTMSVHLRARVARAIASLGDGALDGTPAEVLSRVAQEMAQVEELTPVEFEMVAQHLDELTAPELPAQPDLDIAEVVVSILERRGNRPLITGDLAQTACVLLGTYRPVRYFAKLLHQMVGQGLLVREQKRSKKGRKYYLWSLPEPVDEVAQG